MYPDIRRQYQDIVWYYKVFAWIYGVVGQFSHLVLVNSSWTLNHIVALWNVPDRTHILYPPADTKYLQKFAVDRRAPPRCQPSSSSSSSTNLVISLGQFRPEKNQELQLRAFARFLRNHRQQQQQQEKRPLEEKKGKRIDDKNIKLVLIGGCRNEDDQKRVKNLKHLASTLGILDRVVFEVNASFKLLVEYLAAAHVGLHTMVNEHFGIGVVEFMAAGVIPVAHRSGGPLMDIVIKHKGQDVGFLAETEEEYASCISKVLNLEPAKRRKICEIGRDRVNQFSNEEFLNRFKKLSKSVIFPGKR